VEGKLRILHSLRPLGSLAGSQRVRPEDQAPLSEASFHASSGSLEAEPGDVVRHKGLALPYRPHDSNARVSSVAVHG